MERNPTQRRLKVRARWSEFNSRAIFRNALKSFRANFKTPKNLPTLSNANQPPSPQIFARPIGTSLL